MLFVLKTLEAKKEVTLFMLKTLETDKETLFDVTSVRLQKKIKRTRIICVKNSEIKQKATFLR